MTYPYSPFVGFRDLAVAVRDPDVAVADWTHVFGAPAMPGQRVAVGDACVEFIPAGSGPTGVVQVGVEVDDEPAVAARARAAGATVADDGRSTIVELSGVRIALRTAHDGVTLPRDAGSFTRIHHVVVAVRDDDGATAAWKRVFGFTPAPEGPEATLVSHHVPVGDAWFGLTAAGTDADAVASFVERRGEGVYALSLVVPNRGDFAASVIEAGGRVLGEPDAQQVFVHPATTHGVLVELASEWPGGRFRRNEAVPRGPQRPAGDS